jgi:hypothetical protein
MYFRHENEVHSVVLGDIPEVVPSDFIGRNQLTFFCRQFDRFDSFDVTDNAKIIYILNNDRISVNTPTFLLYVFKPKLDINEHIKVLKCLPKDYVAPEEDSTMLNDFVLTLTNMNKLFVHDGALMSKSTEPEFRVGKFDLIEVFKLQNIDGQFTDFRIFPRAKLIILKHSHLKDFFCLTISRAFLESANSDDLLQPEPKGDEKTVVRISKDYCGKSTSSIQRMSESKKSAVGRVKKVYHTDFFGSQFVIGNTENLSVINSCVRNRFGPDETLQGEETNPGNYDLLFFGIDAASRMFAAKVDIGSVQGNQVKGARDIRMDLSKIFNAQKVDNTPVPEVVETDAAPEKDQPLDTNDPFEKGNSVEVIKPIQAPQEPPETESRNEELLVPSIPDTPVESLGNTQELPKQEEQSLQINLSNVQDNREGQPDSKEILSEEVDPSDRKASEDPFPKEVPEKSEGVSQPTERPKKSKPDSKIDRKRQEEFANELKDYLVEYHKQSVDTVKGFVNDFRKLFVEELRGAVTDQAKSLSKGNYEQVLRSVEHTLTNNFEKSLKKVVEKYTTTCEKAFARLTTILTDEEEGLSVLQRQLTGLMNSQTETSRRIKDYSEAIVEVGRNHQAHQSTTSLNAGNLRSIYQGLSKILEQQKSLSEDFQILSRKVDSIERRRSQASLHLTNIRAATDQSRRESGIPYPHTPYFAGDNRPLFVPPGQMASFKGDESFSLKGMQLPANSRGFTFGALGGFPYSESHLVAGEVKRGDQYP